MIDRRAIELCPPHEPDGIAIRCDLTAVRIDLSELPRVRVHADHSRLVPEEHPYGLAVDRQHVDAAGRMLRLERFQGVAANGQSLRINA